MSQQTSCCYKQGYRGLEEERGSWQDIFQLKQPSLAGQGCLGPTTWKAFAVGSLCPVADTWRLRYTVIEVDLGVFLGGAQSLRPILTALPISFVALVGWWLISFSNWWYLVLFLNEARFLCLAGAVCLASVPLSLGNAVPSAGPRSQDFWRSYLWWSKQDLLLSHPNWRICRMGSYSKNTSFIPGTNLRLKLSFFLHAFVILCGFVSFFILSAELFNSMFSLDLVFNLLLESDSSLLLNFPCLSLNFRAKTMILISLVEARFGKWKTT